MSIDTWSVIFILSLKEFSRNRFCTVLRNCNSCLQCLTGQLCAVTSFFRKAVQFVADCPCINCVDLLKWETFRDFGGGSASCDGKAATEYLITDSADILVNAIKSESDRQSGSDLFI